MIFIIVFYRYVLFGGTLLGSYKYHDVIPWDDDFDLIVDYRDYPKLKRTFQNKIFWSKYNIHGFRDRTNEYEFHLLNQTFPDVYYVEGSKNKTVKRERMHEVKIFKKDQKSAGNNPWKFPFIDIFFFKQNLTHIWMNTRGTQKKKWLTPISEFYPFHLRPCVGMWLPAPKRPAILLKNKYHVFRCQSHRWNHEKEAYVKAEDREPIICENLQSIYVSIKRTKFANGTLESVFLSNELVYSVFVEEKYEIW